MQRLEVVDMKIREIVVLWANDGALSKLHIYEHRIDQTRKIEKSLPLTSRKLHSQISMRIRTGLQKAPVLVVANSTVIRD
jgi:hypothetical protein